MQVIWVSLSKRIKIERRQALERWLGDATRGAFIVGDCHLGWTSIAISKDWRVEAGEGCPRVTRRAIENLV